MGPDATEPEIGPRARIPNPSLERLGFLVGEWRTTGTHPALPGRTVGGRTSFTWHEGGAFLLLAGPDGGPAPPELLALAGLRVRLDGALERRGDLLVFRADPGTAWRP